MAFKVSEIHTQTNQPTCVSEGGVRLCPSIRQRAIQPSLLVLPCHFYSKTHAHTYRYTVYIYTHWFARGKNLRYLALSRELFVRFCTKYASNTHFYLITF